MLGSKKKWTSTAQLTTANGKAYLEEQLFLHTPPALTRKISALLKNNEKREKDVVQFQMNQDNGRRGIVTVDGEAYPCTLIDLPCNIESMKTRDRVNFYKSADLHQVIWVHSEPIKDTSVPVTAPLPPNCNEQFECESGLTPPARRVVRRWKKLKENWPDPKEVTRVEEKIFSIKCGNQEKVQVEVFSETDEEFEAEPDEGGAEEHDGEADGGEQRAKQAVRVVAHQIGPNTNKLKLRISSNMRQEMAKKRGGAGEKRKEPASSTPASPARKKRKIAPPESPKASRPPRPGLSAGPPSLPAPPIVPPPPATTPLAAAPAATTASAPPPAPHLPSLLSVAPPASSAGDSIALANVPHPVKEAAAPVVVPAVPVTEGSAAPPVASKAREEGTVQESGGVVGQTANEPSAPAPPAAASLDGEKLAARRVLEKELEELRGEMEKKQSLQSRTGNSIMRKRIQKQIDELKKQVGAKEAALAAL